MKKIWRDLLIIVFLFAGGWMLFTYIPYKSVKPKALELPIKKEKQLGDKLIKGIRSKYEIAEDTAIRATIDTIKKRLTARLDSSRYNYNILVARNKQVNAFATMGGHIVVFTGLLDFAENPEEVAAILAHEMGHVENRDVVHKVMKEVGLNIVISVLSGGDPGMVSEINRMLLSSAYDRQQEREADRFACNLLTKSNLHPRHLARFMLRMKTQKENIPEELNIFSTHPHSEERVEDALDFSVPDDFKEKTLNVPWKKVKQADLNNK